MPRYFVFSQVLKERLSMTFAIHNEFPNARKSVAPLLFVLCIGFRGEWVIRTLVSLRVVTNFNSLSFFPAAAIDRSHTASRPSESKTHYGRKTTAWLVRFPPLSARPILCQVSWILLSWGKSYTTTLSMSGTSTPILRDVLATIIRISEVGLTNSSNSRTWYTTATRELNNPTVSLASSLSYSLCATNQAQRVSQTSWVCKALFLKTMVLGMLAALQAPQSAYWKRNRRGWNDLRKFLEIGWIDRNMSALSVDLPIMADSWTPDPIFRNPPLRSICALSSSGIIAERPNQTTSDLKLSLNIWRFAKPPPNCFHCVTTWHSSKATYKIIACTAGDKIMSLKYLDNAFCGLSTI